VQNELEPDERDPELAIYAPDARHRPPFSAEFVQRFRAAQRARNRRITDWALEKMQHLKRKNDGEMERAFVVHRTMCDVRWIDPGVDPNGRKPNWCYLGDPRIANAAPAGLARYSSLRSWLSQWSYDRSNGKGPANAARIRTTPVLQIVNQADDAVPATHNPAIRAALATPDKEYVAIEGATHYYVGQAGELKQCLDAVTGWSRRKGLLED
jgi:pimeloyl-ACP methyl ester carboxylesterase